LHENLAVIISILTDNPGNKLTAGVNAWDH